MADEVRSARQALGRGATGEALVHLWNALEPARLAGDPGRLRTIEGIAQAVRAQGDEGESREAERLLETLHRTASRDDGFAVPATSRLDAEVHAGGEVIDEVEGEAPGEEAQRASRFGNLIWVALVVLIVIVNVVSQIRDGG